MGFRSHPSLVTVGDGPPANVEGVGSPAVYLDTDTGLLYGRRVASWAVAGADHAGVIIAASDSPARDRAVANFVCDGVADNVEIQAAIDALPTRGGSIALMPGLYALAAGLTITANKRIRIGGPGAVLTVPADTVGLTISQGSTGGNKRGAFIEDLRFEGGNRAGVTAIALVDTNWSALMGVQIGDCATGILMHANAADEFVEGITLEDVVIRNPSVYGIELRRTNGTNSFAQHSWRNVNINVGAGAIGLFVPQGCSLYRSRMEVGVWIVSNMTAVSIDGDMDNAVLDLFVEGATGATGNTALVIGANATNLDRMEFHFSVWGTVNTIISNASNRLAMYKQGRRFYGVGGAASVQVFGHGQNGAALTLEQAGPAGGRITFGSAAGSLQDVNLYRIGADRLASNDKFESASLKLQTKAGTPVDGDIVGGAANGDVVFDTTNNRLYVRSGGAWVSVVLS